jgi:PRTRC genetic system protein F
MQEPSFRQSTSAVGFQLPALHPTIPLFTFVRHSEFTMAQLARDLVKIGVISPARIAADTELPAHIIAEGLSHWFDCRTRKLQRLHFSFAVMSGTEAQAVNEQFDGSEREFTDAPVLAVESVGQENIYCLQAGAEKIERYFPGMFRAVLDAVQAASYRTVWCRLPGELYDNLSNWFYETDWTEKISNKEALPLLKDRLEDRKAIESYLPSRTRRIFGYQHWSLGKKRKISKQCLIRFIRKSRPSFATRIARETIRLLELTEQVKALDASLPDLCGIYGESYYSACCLFYEDDPIATQALDDIGNSLMNAGDGTEFLGLAQLPTDPFALRNYFDKLDLCLQLLRQLDRVLSLISKPIN